MNSSPFCFSVFFSSQFIDACIIFQKFFFFSFQKKFLKSCPFLTILKNHFQIWLHPVSNQWIEPKTPLFLLFCLDIHYNSEEKICRCYYYIGVLIDCYLLFSPSPSSFYYPINSKKKWYTSFFFLHKYEFVSQFFLVSQFWLFFFLLTIASLYVQILSL